jgi:hypothetical protein
VRFSKVISLYTPSVSQIYEYNPSVHGGATTPDQVRRQLWLAEDWANRADDGRLTEEVAALPESSAFIPDLQFDEAMFDDNLPGPGDIIPAAIAAAAVNNDAAAVAAVAAAVGVEDPANGVIVVNQWDEHPVPQQGAMIVLGEDGQPVMMYEAAPAPADAAADAMDDNAAAAAAAADGMMLQGLLTPPLSPQLQPDVEDAAAAAAAAAPAAVEYEAISSPEPLPQPEPEPLPQPEPVPELQQQQQQQQQPQQQQQQQQPIFQLLPPGQFQLLPPAYFQLDEDRGYGSGDDEQQQQQQQQQPQQQAFEAELHDVEAAAQHGENISAHSIGLLN